MRWSFIATMDRADSLNIVDIARDFVCATDSRANAFGTFLGLIRVPILNNFLKLIIICTLTSSDGQ